MVIKNKSEGTDCRNFIRVLNNAEKIKLINQCFLGFYLPITRARYSVAFDYKAKKLP